MKNIVHRIKLSVWVLLVLFVTTSCESWLDVKPKTEEEAERMFSTEEGFKSALAGTYISLSQPELYGRELTFGMVGVLGQEWEKGPWIKPARHILFSCDIDMMRRCQKQLWRKCGEKCIRRLLM